MKSKLISMASLFMALGILGTSTISHAGSVNLISPKNKTVTTSKVVLVSGKAPKGVNIKVNAYLANLLRNQNIDLNNPPKGGYVLIASDSIKVGASGNFATELSLAKGLNKIQAKLVSGPDSSTRYIFITDASRAREELASVKNARFTSTLQSLIK